MLFFINTPLNLEDALNRKVALCRATWTATQNERNKQTSANVPACCHVSARGILKAMRQKKQKHG